MNSVLVRLQAFNFFFRLVFGSTSTFWAVKMKTSTTSSVGSIPGENHGDLQMTAWLWNMASAAQLILGNFELMLHFKYNFRIYHAIIVQRNKSFLISWTLIWIFILVSYQVWAIYFSKFTNVIKIKKKFSILHPYFWVLHWRSIFAHWRRKLCRHSNLAIRFDHGKEIAF